MEKKIIKLLILDTFGSVESEKKKKNGFNFLHFVNNFLWHFFNLLLRHFLNLLFKALTGFSRKW